MAAIRFWQSNLLIAVPWCTHGVTERQGGLSGGEWASLNLALHVGDEADNVITNRRLAAWQLGFSLDDLVCAEQVHGAQVRAVAGAERGHGALCLTDALTGIDALITDSPNTLLTLFFADCIPVLLADTKRRAVGIAHAGWRGIVAELVENTISAMAGEFGSEPTDILAAVGPGIGSCCFAVGADVAAQFHQDVISDRAAEGTQVRVDLKAAVARRLHLSGIQRANIDISTECTSCNPERFFSYRRERGGRTGRIGAMIGIREEVSGKRN